MAFSLAAVLSGILDGPVNFRALRVSDSEFESDQSVRGLIGPIVLIVGLVAAQFFSYVIGFALVFVAGELLLGVFKARARRDGDPLREQLIDFSRQSSSIALGALCLFAVSLDLKVVTFAYSIPYVIGGLGAAVRVFRLPRLPIARKEWATHSMTGLAGAGYMQLDVLVVGIVVDSAAAGTYGIASLFAWAVTIPSQQHVTRSVPSLRAGRVLPAEFVGSPGLGILSGVGVLTIGAALQAAAFAPNDLGACLMLLAPFVATRSVNWALNTSMIFAHLDSVRLRATLITLAANIGLLVALAGALGVVAAATSSTLADLLLIAIYAKALKAHIAPRYLVAYVLLVTLSVTLAFLS